MTEGEVLRIRTVFSVFNRYGGVLAVAAGIKSFLFRTISFAVFSVITYRVIVHLRRRLREQVIPN